MGQRACENEKLWLRLPEGGRLQWRYRLGVQDAALSRRKPGFESRYRYQNPKSCKIPNKTEESVTRAEIVTTSVTTPGKKAGLPFLSTEYYLEGEGDASTVTVIIRAKLNGKYPYLPAAWNGHGRLKPNVALVDGNEQKVQGRYYRHFTEGGKRRFGLVGAAAAMAAAAAQKKETAIKAKALGIALVEEIQGERIKLADAIAAHKAEIEEHKVKRTYVAYAYALGLFVRGCNKTGVDV